MLLTEKEILLDMFVWDKSRLVLLFRQWGSRRAAVNVKSKVCTVREKRRTKKTFFTHSKVWLFGAEQQFQSRTIHLMGVIEKKESINW